MCLTTTLKTIIDEISIEKSEKHKAECIKYNKFIILFIAILHSLFVIILKELISRCNFYLISDNNTNVYVIAFLFLIDSKNER